MIASHSSGRARNTESFRNTKLRSDFKYGNELGEGSGAALAFNIIEASNYTYENMATFDEVDMGR